MPRRPSGRAAQRRGHEVEDDLPVRDLAGSGRGALGTVLPIGSVGVVAFACCRGRSGIRVRLALSTVRGERSFLDASHRSQARTQHFLYKPPGTSPAPKHCLYLHVNIENVPFTGYRT